MFVGHEARLLEDSLPREMQTFYYRLTQNFKSRTKIGLFANGSQDYLVLVNTLSALVTALSEGTEPHKATYQIFCLLYKVMSTKT